MTAELPRRHLVKEVGTEPWTVTEVYAIVAPGVAPYVVRGKDEVEARLSELSGEELLAVTVLRLHGDVQWSEVGVLAPEPPGVLQ